MTQWINIDYEISKLWLYLRRFIVKASEETLQNRGWQRFPQSPGADDTFQCCGLKVLVRDNCLPAVKVDRQREDSEQVPMAASH